MKLVAISVGVLALGGLAYFAWRAHRTADGAVFAAAQAANNGAPPAADGPAGAVHVETIGPVSYDRKGRGAF